MTDARTCSRTHTERGTGALAHLHGSATARASPQRCGRCREASRLAHSRLQHTRTHPQVLLDAKADVQHVNKGGMTVLLWAAHKGQC